MSEFKFEVDADKTKNFNPFKLTIEVDSVEKLATLLSMFNSSDNNIIDSLVGGYRTSVLDNGVPDFQDIWSFLDTKWKKYDRLHKNKEY